MTKRESATRGLFGLLAAVLVALAPAAALAHKGHAGPMVTFVETQAALKAMLPEGAKIFQRKERLAAEGAGWAKDTLGVSVEAGVYAYYLARDRDSGKVLGAAMVREADYEHAEVMLAVGVDADGRVTRAALLGTNEQFVPEFQDGVGTGFLKDLAGATAADLKAGADEAPKDNEARRFVLGQLKDMAALLAALIHGAQA
jgi:hypothetical protein